MDWLFPIFFARKNFHSPTILFESSNWSFVNTGVRKLEILKEITKNIKTILRNVLGIFIARNSVFSIIAGNPKGNIKKNVNMIFRHVLGIFLAGNSVFNVIVVDFLAYFNEEAFAEKQP